MLEKIYGKVRESFNGLYHGSGYGTYFFRFVVLFIVCLIIYRAFS